MFDINSIMLCQDTKYENHGIFIIQYHMTTSLEEKPTENHASLIFIYWNCYKQQI